MDCSHFSLLNLDFDLYLSGLTNELSGSKMPVSMCLEVSVR